MNNIINENIEKRSDYQTNSANEYILEICDVSKKYGGIQALNGINMKIKKGEVHALVGENGAGKSTLIKVLTGAIKPTTGYLVYEGKKYEEMKPDLSFKIGITAIYQEFNLIPYLTVAENIFFGNEKMNGIFRDTKKMDTMSKELFADIGLEINPNTQIRHLGIAQQQLVEIAKAISKNAKLVIMDEPSAPLTEKETQTLYEIVNKLTKKGITVVYISHRLEEVFDICDRVSVLRDGQYISTQFVSETNREELIKKMVGRELGEEYPDSPHNFGEEILEVKNFTTKRIKDVSFTLHKGEILGLAGLVGAGRTEIARAIYGIDKIENGVLQLSGKEIYNSTPNDALKNNIGLLPEDRKGQGVIMEMSIKENITFSILKNISKCFFIDLSKETQISNNLVDSLSIKINSLDQYAKNLSGGNQQKVVLAKILATKSDVLIMDEPTRGIDVGAKQEIYKIMRDLANQGKAIIMISSDMPELIGMSDRILVVSEGKIVKELTPPEYSQETILKYASL